MSAPCELVHNYPSGVVTRGGLPKAALHVKGDDFEGVLGHGVRHVGAGLLGCPSLGFLTAVTRLDKGLNGVLHVDPEEAAAYLLEGFSGGEMA